MKNGTLQVDQSFQLRFEALARATSDGVYDWDLPAGTIWWSENFRKSFGYAELGDGLTDSQWWRSRVHPDDIDAVEASRAAALAGKDDSWSSEYRFLRSDSEYTQVIDRASIVRSEEGDAIRVVGTFADGRDRTRVEQALRESESRFRQIFESNMIGIAFWHADGRILDVNDAFCEMIGCSRDDVDRRLVNWKTLPGITWDAWDAATMAELRSTGVCIPFEKELRRGEGETSTLLIGAALVEGRRDLGVAFVADLSDRKRAEETLRLSEERFRALIENSLDVATIIDSDGSVRYVSPTVNRVFGYDPRQLIDHPLLDRVHEDDRPRVEQNLLETAENPGSTGRAEFRFQHSNGSWREVELVASHLLEHPAIGGIVITMRDITDRKAVQSQLEQAKRLSSLGRLAATIAHEFNNVLMGIQPFAEVIRRVGGEDTRLMNAADHIQRSVQRGKRITSDILRFTQPAQPTLTVVSVAKWLQDLVPEIRALLGPSFELKVSEVPAQLSILADTAQLNQVLTNLALNARDAMSPGGQLTIEIRQPAGEMIYPFGIVSDAGRFAHISVSDTGSGMTREVMTKVFEPLFTTKRSGTGLGLAVAHQVIDRHGGSIHVDSRPGAGTTFHLFLPRTQAAAEPLAIDGNRPTIDPTRSWQILLVEDEKPVASGIASLLQLSGFSVRIAETGEQAIFAAEGSRPDAIILDVGLPDMNGFVVFDRLRARHRDVPIVFSTAHGDRNALLERGRHHAVAFLQKPYELDALMAALHHVLNAKTER